MTTKKLEDYTDSEIAFLAGRTIGKRSWVYMNELIRRMSQPRKEKMDKLAKKTSVGISGWNRGKLED